ncbi:MAG: trypsin-like peptidase domain-containing protein [Bryobacteraceae bacterium]
MNLFRAAFTTGLLVFVATAQEKPAPPPPVSLRELSLSLEHLSNRVHASVVQIFSTGYAAQESEASGNGVLNRQRSTASGVVISADGYIVTNLHVVRGARRIQVPFPATRQDLAGKRSVVKPEGRTLDAKVIGMDRESDLALVKVEANGLAHLALGNSDNLRQGQLVMAFGNPLGLESSVSLGIVSSTARQIRPDDPMIYIQTDAPINPGNSGGPLVDAAGQLVGINTFILSQSGGSEGIGFAIPSNIVRNVIRQVKKDGHVHRGQIGLYAQTITPAIAKGLNLPQDWGVLVGDVQPDGAADKAGVKVGDIILGLNGKPMENARQLEVNIYRYPEDEKVSLEVLRGTEKMTFEIPVASRRDDPDRFADMVSPEENMVPRLGLLCIAIDKKLAGMLPELRNAYGIVVADGSARDLTSGTGLQPGDVIYSVDGFPVATIPAFRKKLDEYKPGDAPVFQIERSGRLMFVAIELE